MIMTWIVEIILMCIFIYGAYYGYVSGFFKLCIRPFRTVIGVILAFSLCKPIGSMLILPMLETSVENYLEEYFANNNFNEIPTVIKIVGVMSDNEELINSNYTASEIVSRLTLPFVTLISSATAFVLLYYSIKLMFSVFVSVANTLFGAGIIGKINRGLGTLFAMLLSIIALWCIVGTVDFVFHSNAFAEMSLVRNFVPGPIYKTLRNLSPIELLLRF